MKLNKTLYGVQLNKKPICYVTHSRGIYRSRTFKEIAQAIAKQWGDFMKNDLEKNTKK